MTSLTRRDLLRGLSLATLAVTAAPLLTACGGGGGGGDASVKGLTLVSSDVQRTAAPDSAIPAAVAGVHGLGAGLYGLLSGTAGNLALSPFSIAVALGLTVNGAVGTTQTEMLNVLGATDVAKLDEGLDALTAYVESLAGEVPGNDGKKAELVLDSANAMFGQLGESWEKPFLDTLARSYGAGMLTVDWKGATEAARAAVNTWAAKQTRDKITEILPAGSVAAMTRLVLVNALYFKAPWEEPFDKDGTSPQDFHLTDGTVVQVPTMSQTLATPYAAGKGYDAVQLRYSGGDVAMTMFLPEVGGLAALEKRIAGGGLPAMLQGLEGTQVSLSLPTWTYRTQASLAGDLGTLGMPTAFEAGKADFSAMTTEDQLYVSDVLHQVYVAVSEGGTEAAAVTAAVMEATSAPAPGAEVGFDRPFLFLIHDVAQGTPLFLGRVADPRG